ncbi:MAG: hypothetical protein QW304_09290 [Thermoproteota archaeon]
MPILPKGTDGGEDSGFVETEVRGTLSLKPGEDERVEEPERDIDGKAFVCIKALKTEGGQQS